MKRWTIMGAAAALLAGCGSEQSGTNGDDGGEISVAHDDGEGSATAIAGRSDGNVRVESGSDVPIDLPDGFSIYPGAEVVTNTVFDEGDSKGALVTMESDASAEAMVEHYRRQAEGAGVEIELNLTTDTMAMIGGKSADGSPFSFTATREGGAAKTTGQLMVGEAFQ
jgi:hypothetical protein